MDDGRGEYVSLAYDLGDLTDSQLQSLLSLVGQTYKIRISEDWNTDQKEYGIVFLVKYPDSKNLGVMDEIIQKRKRSDLKTMVERYEQAIEDSGFDTMVLFPLVCCIGVAKDIVKGNQQTILPEILGEIVPIEPVNSPANMLITEFMQGALDQQKDAIQPLIVAVEKVATAVTKNTAETKKGFQSLKMTNNQSLEELIKIIPTPPHEHWVTAQEVADHTSEPIANLNKQRQRGEQVRDDSLVFGRDPEGRIWCRSESSNVVFYLKSTVPGMSR